MDSKISLSEPQFLKHYVYIKEHGFLAYYAFTIDALKTCSNYVLEQSHSIIDRMTLVGGQLQLTMKSESEERLI